MLLAVVLEPPGAAFTNTLQAGLGHGKVFTFIIVQELEPVFVSDHPQMWYDKFSHKHEPARMIGCGTVMSNLSQKFSTCMCCTCLTNELNRRSDSWVIKIPRSMEMSYQLCILPKPNQADKHLFPGIQMELRVTEPGMNDVATISCDLGISILPVSEKW